MNHEVPVFTRLALERGLASGPCLICAAVRASERKSIHNFLYEGMMSPTVRQDFLRKGGFCRRHFWIANEIEEDSWQAGGIGLALLCEDLLRVAGESFNLTASASRQNKRAIMRRAQPVIFKPGWPCMFCEENTTRESYLLEILEDLLEDPQFQAVLEGRSLCVSHAQLAASKWKSQYNRASIAAALRTQLQLLAGEMRAFIDKHDYQHRSDLSSEEAHALWRAIQILVGSDQGVHKNGERS